MLKLLILSSCFLLIRGSRDYLKRNPNDAYEEMDEEMMHPVSKTFYISDKNDRENFANYWNENAVKTIKKIIAQKKKINKNEAKNILLFMGDGMSFPTLTATRVYIGGENVQLAFEKFPYTAISKTYCVDKQISDSGATSTAYLGGVKGNYQTIGVTASVDFRNCETMANSSNHVHSIAQWAQLEGKSTGIVTTAGVTHASPAGVYAHTANRRWESDSDVKNDDKDPSACTDIATQLVNGDVGKNLNVIMGGSRSNFLPKEMKDEEGAKGRRLDKQNLIEKWKELKKNEKAKYIWNRDQLINLDHENTDYVLGLFSNHHCPYHLHRNKKIDPSLSEMVAGAIKVLSKNKKGYFLFVEGGRIDMAHHSSYAHLALEECAEFSRAVDLANTMINEEDSLIVVTADHAHSMTMTGYPPRKNDIFGMGDKDTFNLSYTTLNYVSGPGYKPAGPNESRYVVSEEDIRNINFSFPAQYHRDSGAHGGEDVGIYAKGPWAHLFHGVIEQNVIPHIMAYASGIGKDLHSFRDDKKANGGTYYTPISLLIPLILVCSFMIK